MDLPNRYKRLIALGIDKSANLGDLNDMTDRSKDPKKPPLKPWTANKTIGAIDLIKRHRIRDEGTLLEKFQQESKIPLQTLTEQVYEHQLNYFGKYKYDKDTIFKYAYCCIIINSLRGNSTEKRFDMWARSMNIKVKKPPAVLDQKFHADRLKIDNTGKVKAFISVKPNSFRHNFLQYTDVFVGLQTLTRIAQIPWIIYYRDMDEFKWIDSSMLNAGAIKIIETRTSGYSKEELDDIKQIIKNL